MSSGTLRRGRPAPSAPAAPERARARRRGIALGAALLLCVLVVPSLSAFYVDAAGQMAVYAIVALGASLIIQHADLPSIGHGAFYGLAGYGVALLMLHGVAGTLPALALALLATGAFAVVMGLVVLRTRAAYFMMITLAIGQLLSGIASSMTSVTGGDNGLTGLPAATVAGIDLTDPTQFYFACLAVLVLVAAFVAWLISTPYGHALRSLKRDDRRARSLGVGPLRVRLLAFALSGVITGLGGALATLNAGYVEPSVLGAGSSGAIFLMVALAGRLGVLGPIAGAVLVEGITLIVGAHTTHSQLVLGVVAAAIALFVMRSGPAAAPARRPAEPAAQEAGDA